MSNRFDSDAILADEKSFICTCPKTKCKWHGNCRDCTAIHRYLKTVPNCFVPEDGEKSKSL